MPAGRLRAGFAPFVEACGARRWPFEVLSHGLTFYIRPLLPTGCPLTAFEGRFEDGRWRVDLPAGVTVPPGSRLQGARRGRAARAPRLATPPSTSATGASTSRRRARATASSPSPAAPSRSCAPRPACPSPPSRPSTRSRARSTAERPGAGRLSPRAELRLVGRHALILGFPTCPPNIKN
jgi:hypothetical protein